MAESLGAKLVKRSGQLFKEMERNNAVNMWDSISVYLNPNNPQNFLDEGGGSEGSKSTQHIYDSCGAAYIDELCSTMKSIFTPPNIIWSRLQVENAKLNAQPDVQDYLNKVERIIHNYLDTSNFNQSMNNYVESVIKYGTGNLFCEYTLNSNNQLVGLTFKNHALKEWCFTEDEMGNCTFFTRRFKLSNEAAHRKWADTLDADVIKQAKNFPDAKRNYLLCIYKNDEAAQNSVGVYKKNKAPYVGYYVDEDLKQVLGSLDFKYNPVIVGKADQACNEKYGRGYGHKIYPDVVSINQLMKRYLQQVAFAARPASKVEEDGAINDYKYEPGAQIIMRNGGIDAFEIIEHGADFKAVQDMLERLEMKIKICLHLDKIQLPPREKVGEMTMYEIAQRRIDAQRIAGPFSERMHLVLKSVISWTYDVLKDHDALPTAPTSIQNSREKLKIEYVNPLSRSQNAEDIQAINQWLQFVTGAAAAGLPEMIDNVDIDTTAKTMGKLMNVPLDVQSPEEAVEKKRQDRKQLQEKMMASEERLKNADAASKEAKTNTGGSSGGGLI